ncbi:MAG: hypothetical protein AB7N76_29055 [Planctomycetota bacterium]
MPDLSRAALKRLPAELERARLRDQREQALAIVDRMLAGVAAQTAVDRERRAACSLCRDLSRLSTGYDAPGAQMPLSARERAVIPAAFDSRARRGAQVFGCAECGAR